MATLNRTFSVKNGIDVANTIIVDGSRNLSNIATANATTVNAATFITTGGLNVTDQANAARLQANTARDQANAAYNDANTRVLKAGDTMTGNLIMSGATINTSTANISTITTSNTLTLSTTSGSNGNVVISANGKDIIRANDNCVAIGLSLADTSGAPLTVRLNSAYLGAVASFQQKNISGAPLGEMIFKTGSGYALIDHYDVNIADQTTRSFGFSPSRFYVSMEGNTQLAVVPSGKLGVFTEDPTSNLHVIGNANITLGIVTGAGINAATVNATTINASTILTNSGINVSAQAADSYDQANTARGQANTARNTANDAYGASNTAQSQADAARGQANTARDVANGAYAQANGAYGQANGAYSQANGAYAQANTGIGTANGAYAQANGAYAQANGAYGQANIAYSQANSAYAAANLKLNLTGGTISGDLIVSGNLEILGNSTTLNVETLAVEDNEIILNSNVTGTPALDGFITINRGSSTNAVLKWDEATDQWKWADGEGTFYALDSALDAYASANAGYAQANTARSTANDAYGQANTARDQANTARTQANTARDQANTAYGQANDAFGQANTARSQANAAYAQANAAYADANTRVLKSGDTMTGVLTITNSGFGLAVGNAAVTYELSIGSLNVTTNTVTTSATGQIVLDTFATTEHASAKYFVQVKSGSAYHTTEVVLVQDATNVWLTEYGSIQTGASLGSFSADISSGDVRLLFNADNAVNTIRAVRYGVAPP